ncbi:CmpA/NrtA family ABC transporter substrate-binding protein [Frankia nepalensis]|uniref:ABC transporter substrate-binding protein n=1 Tax=Frankia nepalensis TaxID=1836974 RepID=A0A937RJ29_9ACTN|nr:CmpA/NrtA family ABC transporter substrate-binding protein [Frankia nepalensis]MBL7628269.1 ABC transporter substrate-binding protein [Frankia nepalensis]
MDRRTFFKSAGVAALGATALAACGSDSSSSSTSGTSGNRKVRLGFIALTDCAPILMASELGYFAERGLDVSVVKQASWPATRDALLNNQIDGAHCLYSMPLSVATKIGGSGSTALKVAMILNNNGQAITLAKEFSSVGYADLDKAKAALESKQPTLAMTFPGGTHDLWIRYWLRAAKVDMSAVKVIPIPPPQMVANMKVGTMTGYCVGEPWNAVAVSQNVGFTHLTTQDLWTGHPEKALVVGEKFATEQEDALRDTMGAILKAARWLDDPANRAKAVDVLAQQKYLNTPAAGIRGRLLGEYDFGAGIPGRTYPAAENMRFFGDGFVSAPRRGHALWALAQYQRLGLVDSVADPEGLVNKIVLRGLYEEVAAAEKIDVPDDDLASFTVKLDGASFDPKEFAKEVARV